MSDYRVEVHGADELNADLHRLAGKIDTAADVWFRRVADQAAADVKGRVPKRTGRLAGSVTAKQIGDGAEVQMGAGVRYAEYVEYGGRGHPHSSQGNYLYPAVLDAEPALVLAGQKAAAEEIAGMSWSNT